MTEANYYDHYEKHSSDGGDMPERFVPESNSVQVSSRKDPGFFVFISKIYLKKYGEIELHAMG